MNSRISITFNQYPCVAGLLAGWYMCQLLSSEIWFLRSVNSNKNSIFFSHRRTRLIEPPPHTNLPQFTPKSFPACYENIFLVFDSFAGLRRAYSEKIWFFSSFVGVSAKAGEEGKQAFAAAFRAEQKLKPMILEKIMICKNIELKINLLLNHSAATTLYQAQLFTFIFSRSTEGTGSDGPPERVEYLSLMVFYFSPSFFHLHRLRYCSLFSGLPSKLIYGHEYN